MKKDKKIEIDAITYNNNLNFYTLLKLLIQCHLSEKQLIFIQKTINDNLSVIEKDKSIVKTLLIETHTLFKPETDKFASFNYFLNTLESMDSKMWCEFIDICVDLLLVKDLILQESKVYATTQYKKELNSIKDLLSIEYDMSTIHLPYGQRVVSSLLLYAFTDIKRKNDFILSSSENIIKNISFKVKKLLKQYNLNVNNMFHIIMDESMNQSIKSDAGSSYESRVAQSLAPVVENLKGHSHDSKISSVEYDNTFYFNKKFCGVSAKRTLRERYKQNFEDTDLLDVDYLFIITLGTDLNELKLNNILQKKGIYVIVSQEEYEARSFLKECDRVISSSNLVNEFNEIIK